LYGRRLVNGSKNRSIVLTAKQNHARLSDFFQLFHPIFYSETLRRHRHGVFLAVSRYAKVTRETPKWLPVKQRPIMFFSDSSFVGLDESCPLAVSLSCVTYPEQGLPTRVQLSGPLILLCQPAGPDKSQRQMRWVSLSLLSCSERENSGPFVSTVPPRQRGNIDRYAT
jgi:hypothetical protein